MCFATKATPIHKTDGKCHIKKTKSCRTGLTGYYRLISAVIYALEDAHTPTPIHTCIPCEQKPSLENRCVLGYKLLRHNPPHHNTHAYTSMYTHNCRHVY